MQVRGVFGSRDGFFSPTKMWKPWKKPVPCSTTYNAAAYVALSNFSNINASMNLVKSFETLAAAA